MIRDLPILASNWRSEKTLPDYLREHEVVAIADIDTRKLTRLLRDKGAQRGCIIAGEAVDAEQRCGRLTDFPACKAWIWQRRSPQPNPMQWTENVWHIGGGPCGS